MKKTLDPTQRGEKRILYVASTASHLERFHTPYIEALKEDGYSVDRMANGEGVERPIPFSKTMLHPKNLISAVRIRRILKKENYAKVIVNTSLSSFLVCLAMVGMRNRPYLINIVHGYLFGEPAGSTKERFLRHLEKLVAKKTDVLAVMNEEDEKIAKKYHLCPSGAIERIYGMGLATRNSDAPDKREEIRRMLGVKENEKLLCYVGELSKRKHQDFLIRATGRLRCEGFPVKLLLLGEGSKRETFEKQVRILDLQDAVFFCGDCSPATEYLPAADLYVSASRSEGLPFNIMEAMEAGLPILASDVKGQKDLLKGSSAVLYPVDDEEAFCKAVKGWKDFSLRSYPELENYRLERVFERNISLMKK